MKEIEVRLLKNQIHILNVLNRNNQHGSIGKNEIHEAVYDTQQLINRTLKSNCNNTEIQPGDTVEVYCPVLSSEKIRRTVKAIEGEYCIFDVVGKIQLEWCRKV